MIRKSDKSAVLYDYERANYKGLIEALRKIRQENYNKSLDDNLKDERGREFSVVSPYENGEYYDLFNLHILIREITNTISNNVIHIKYKYNNNDSDLHEKILNLCNAKTLEEFLQGVENL